jgi:DNA replication licensing factor MCM4
VLNINIDCQNMEKFPSTKRLYDQLVKYPQEIIPIMDLVVYEEFTRIFGKDSLGQQRIQVRAFNLRELTKMRDLNPSDIGQMVRRQKSLLC